jgi:hypothetical protein
LAGCEENSPFEAIMSAEAKKEYGSTLALIIFGLMALFLGVNWLSLLIPAAALVWYGVRPLGTGRN